MLAIDSIIAAVLDAVQKSGILTSNTLMATVTVVNSNGTVQVERAGDTYPKVRRLASYSAPAVGDVVEIMKTNGGWICLGELA